MEQQQWLQQQEPQPMPQHQPPQFLSLLAWLQQVHKVQRHMRLPAMAAGYKPLQQQQGSKSDASAACKQSSSSSSSGAGRRLRIVRTSEQTFRQCVNSICRPSHVRSSERKQPQRRARRQLRGQTSGVNFSCTMCLLIHERRKRERERGTGRERLRDTEHSPGAPSAARPKALAGHTGIWAHMQRTSQEQQRAGAHAQAC